MKTRINRALVLLLSCLGSLGAATPKLSTMWDTNTGVLYPTNLLRVDTIGITNLSNPLGFFTTNNPSFLNIEHFGATTTSTNNFTAVSNAVAYAAVHPGTIVWFPPKTYKMSQVMVSNVYLYGPGATIHQVPIADTYPGNYASLSGSNPTAYQFPKRSAAFFIYRSGNVTFDGITFEVDPTANFFPSATNAPGAQPSVTVWYGTNVVFKNCTFGNTNGLSIELGACKNVTVVGNKFPGTYIQTGQSNLYNDGYYDSQYDSTTTYGGENLDVADNFMFGTNVVASKSAVFFSGMQSFKLRNNVFKNIGSTRCLWEIYSGDRGLHYFDGTTASNMVFEITGNKVQGTNNYWGSTLGGILRARGYSGSPDSSPGREDSLKHYTAYGSIVANNVVESGTGYEMLLLSMSGLTFRDNQFIASGPAISVEQGFINDLLLERNYIKRTAQGNSSATFITKGAVTNINWTLKDNIFIGAGFDGSMLWHPSLAWDNLTLRGNQWHSYSTNASGGDALFRIIVTNKFLMENETFYLHTTNTFWDSPVFDVTQATGSSVATKADVVIRGTKVISDDSTLPLYAGYFSMDRGRFYNNDFGRVKMRFFDRGYVVNNRFYSLSGLPSFHVEDTPYLVFNDNELVQATNSASGFAAFYQAGTGGTIVGENNSITAKSTVAAVLLGSSGAILANQSTTNSSSGGLYSGKLAFITDTSYAWEVSRAGNNGKLGISFDNYYGGGDADVGFFARPSSGVGGFSFYNWDGAASVFAFGSNPLPSGTRQFQIGGQLVKINDVAYTFPASQGAASTVLQNDGAGTLSWSASGGGGGTSVYVNGTSVANPNFADSSTTFLATSATTNISVYPTNLANAQISASAAILLTKITTPLTISAVTNLALKGGMTMDNLVVTNSSVFLDGLTINGQTIIDDDVTITGDLGGNTASFNSLTSGGLAVLTTANISDTAWASSWNGVTTISPSKNAVYDWGHTFDTDDDGKVNVLDMGAGLVKTDSGGVVSAASAGTDYVAPATTITAGAGISGGGDLSANRTITWAPDTFVGNVSLWDGANATRTLTANLSGTDPVVTFGSSSVDVTTGTLKQGGTAVALQSRAVATGAGLSGGGDLSADRTHLWAPDTFVNNITFWDSANATRTWTAGLSGATDPVWTYSDNSADLTTGVLKVAGTSVNAASILTSGTVATARLGSGTANSTTVLYGDSSYKTPFTGTAGTMINAGTTVAGSVPYATDTASTNYAASGALYWTSATNLFAITNAPTANTAPTGGLELRNYTVASSGNQQYSPGLFFEGEGWKTTATAASQPVRFRQYVVPVQGSANPSATFTLDSSINGAAFGNALTYTSAGAFTAAGNLSSGGNVTAGTANSYFISGRGGINARADGELQVMMNGAVNFGVLYAGYNSSTPFAEIGGGAANQAMRVGTGYSIDFLSTANVITGTADTGFGRYEAGVLRVTDASVAPSSGGGVGALITGVRELTKTSNYTVKSDDSGTYFNNTGAGGAVTFTLPTAAARLHYYFYNDAAQTLNIAATGSDVWQVGSYTSGTAKTFATVTKGHWCHVHSPKALLWVVDNMSEAWTIDSLARRGNAVLVAGTVTVNNATVTANSALLLTRKTSGGTLGTAITYTLSAGTSFTITSDSALDTSTFTWSLQEIP